MKNLKAQYYNSIKTTPLEVFRIVQDTDDFKPLLISGEFSNEDAAVAWMQLYDEYSMAVKSKSNNVVFALKKQVYVLIGEIQLISNCLFMIQELYNCNLISMEKVHDLSFFIKTINDYGFKFNEEDGVPTELERVKKQLRNKNSQIESLNKRIAGYNTGQKSKFMDTIAAVEKYMGFQINEQNTTVSKFVSYFNQLIQAQNAKQHKDNRVSRGSR